MSNTFTGTISIDGDGPTNVTAFLTKEGNRIRGQILYDSDNNFDWTVDWTVVGTDFTTVVNSSFLTPTLQGIVVLPLVAGETSVDTGFTLVDITAANCLVNGVNGVLDLSLTLVPIAEWSDSEGIGDVVDETSEVSGLFDYKQVNPVRVNLIGNYFDHFGAVRSLPRLHTETNLEYIERIISSINRASNSSYEGLMNGINRELGLAIIPQAIRVAIKETPAGERDEIRLLITEHKARIYSQWIPVESQRSGLVPTVERETDLEDLTVGELVDWINDSDNFEAFLKDADPNAPAWTIHKADSWKWFTETLPGQEQITFEEANIIPGFLLFAENDELATELEPGSTPTAYGEYSVDYEAGILTATRAPRASISFFYLANQEEFYLEWSPVKIMSMSEEGSHEYLFNQLEQTLYSREEDHYLNGMPTNEGYRILREIIKGGDYPQFWGE